MKLNSSKKNNYRHELDGLRALAVISVIINHFDKSLLPSGYLGVDIFFVLSGFVITGSLTNRNIGSLGDFISQFYVRRVKRLVPTLILVSLVTGICTIALVYKPGFSIKTGLYSLIGFSNHSLLNASTDYFSSSTQLNTFTHTWSLGVEEQFYFIFPIIFWLTVYFRKSPQNKLLFFVIGILSVISIYLFIYLNNVNQSMAYFIMPSRFWELGIGCLTSVLTTYIRESKREIKIYSLPILLLLISSLFIPQIHHLLNTISVVLLTSLLIILIKPGHISFRIFTQKHIKYIGLISYSLYLWHWPILSLSRWTIGIDLYTALWQIPLMVILSILTYKYVENTLRKSTWSLKSRNTIIIGIGSSALAITILAGAYFFRDTILLKPFPWKNLTPIVQILECHLPKCDDPITQCLYNQQKDKNAIYIIGDSHAGNLVPSVKKAIGNKMVVKYLTDRALILSIFGSSDCGGTNCSENEYQSRLDFFSKNLKEGDIVIFSIARDRIYNRSIAYPDDRKNSLVKERLDLLQVKLKKLGELIAKKKSIFILVDDIPKLCDDYDIEVRKNPMNPCPIEQSISIKDRQPLTNIYLSLMNNSVRYLDPHPVLCPDKTCYAIFNDTLLYSDESPHFIEFNATPLTNLFKSTLLKKVGETNANNVYKK
jgi:peptidoglycan/LPS O-acetylase OafA/YrhL